MRIDTKALLYGILAGAGILSLFIVVTAIFQGSAIAVYEFKRLWVWLVPLSIGFGAQIGLYFSIKHDATMRTGVKTSGSITGGSMIICCSHYLLNIIPIISLTALSEFLMSYQKAFFGIGIISSITGITLMLNHKRKMEKGAC